MQFIQEHSYEGKIWVFLIPVEKSNAFFPFFSKFKSKDQLVFASDSWMKTTQNLSTGWSSRLNLSDWLYWQGFQLTWQVNFRVDP